MSSKSPRSPSSTTLLSFGSSSRRGSLASLTGLTRPKLDKEQMDRALDAIHSSASQSGSLTTFNEFTVPPSTSSSTDQRGLGSELMHNGLSGLYNRVRGAVTGHKDRPSSPLAKRDKSQTNDIQAVPPASPSSSVIRFQAFEDSSAMTGSRRPDGETSHLLPPTAASSKSTNETMQQKLAPGPAQIVPVAKASASATVAPVYASGVRPLPKPLRADDMSETTAPSVSPIGRDLSVSRASPTHIVDDSDYSYQHSRLSASPGNSSIHDVAARSDLQPVDGNNEAVPQSPALARTQPASLDTGKRLSVEAETASGLGRLVSPDRGPDSIQQVIYSSAGPTPAVHSVAEISRINAAAQADIQHRSSATGHSKNQGRATGERISGSSKNQGQPALPNSRLEQMRKQVLSKEFWMSDDICKECFLCGNTFTAFRRKHHCRTCGCIFDSKCTTIVAGERFGVHGTLRVCKTCLGVINRRHDDSSDESGDDGYIPTSFFQSQKAKVTALHKDNTVRVDPGTTDVPFESELPKSSSLTTPMMAIPAARRIADSPNRRSAVLEIDAPQLSRPASARSLKSMAAARPAAFAHKRQHSRHNLLDRLRGTPIANADQRAPFARDPNDEPSRTNLPAFHDDNIIDPALAPFLSDDESSGEEQMSIFGALNDNSIASPHFEAERAAFGSFLSSGRKSRSRGADKAVNGVSFVNLGMEEPEPALPPTPFMRPNRRRNLSASSATFHHVRNSPRHGRTSSMHRGISSYDDDSPHGDEYPFERSTMHGPSKMVRSVSMRDENAPIVKLNKVSLQHVRLLFRQLLQDSKIPRESSWEKALIPILLRSTDDVNPDIRRGDAMDIRHYVKLKKIPGGKPGDSAYISGISFTKNLALKSMSRKISNPRIVLISFPIEYQKHQQHFMSIEPVIAQERDFLRNMVNRIVSLRPQLVLVQRNISGLALQYLSEAGVAVAYNVKKSVIEAVSRFTQTEIISSIDMVALKPVHVGRSEAFAVKTYTHGDIPGGKKTYMQISGCQKELGCTIVLRGAPIHVLSKMKLITEFMVYVVYNLKLETCLMRDELVLVPQTSHEMQAPSTVTTLGIPQPEGFDTVSSMQPADDAQAKLDDVTQAGLMLQEIQSPTEPLPSDQASPLSVDEIARSSSPEPSIQLEETTQSTIVSAHEYHLHDDRETRVPADVPAPAFYSDMVDKYQTRILSASPFVKFMQPYLLMRSREQERRLFYLKQLRDQDSFEEQSHDEKPRPQKFQLIQPEMVHEKMIGAPKTIMEILHAVHDAEYDKALHNYQRQKRQWEIYIQNNMELFNPFAHQNIVVSYSVVCTATSIPCNGPDVIAMSYYSEHSDSDLCGPDCTLGQYVEDLCDSVDDTCGSSTCERRMFDHHRAYVHGEARITIVLDKVPAKIKGLHDSILMWNYCKKCEKDTQVMPMSESTWKYSFGKYLEMSFWSSGLRVRDDHCTHDLHKDHIRYFGYHNVAMRVHFDPIDLLEVVAPRTRITWKVDNDLRMKNDIFVKTEERWNKFMTSVKSRIRGINTDSVAPEKMLDCRAEVERLTKHAHDEHIALLMKLQEKYTESKYYEIVPLNRAVRAMQEKVAGWDAAFAKFDADFFPSEKDIRRLAALQLKKMFLDRDSSTTSLVSNDAHEQSTQIEDIPQEKLISSQEFSPDAAVRIVVDQDIASPNMEQNDILATVAPLSVEDMQTVDHLDLAIPLDTLPTPLPDPVLGYFPDLRAGASNTSSHDLQSKDESDLATPMARPVGIEMLDTADGVEAPEAVTPLASESSLVQRITRLRKASQVDGEHFFADPSHIPHPVEKSRMRSGISGQPTSLDRAHSQPTMPVMKRVVPKSGTPFHVRGDSTKGNVSQEDILQVSPLPHPEFILDPRLSDRLGLSARTPKKGSMIPRSVTNSRRRESKVSTLAKHFEQLSREFEKERQRDRRQRAAKVTQSRAFPKASSKPIVEVYKDVDEAIDEHDRLAEDSHDVEPTHPNSEIRTAADDAAAMNPEMQISRPQSPALSTIETVEEHSTEPDTGDEQVDTGHNVSDDDTAASDVDHSLLDDLPSVSDLAESLGIAEPVPDIEIPKHEKSSYLKMLTNFWAERSASGWTPLDYPLNTTDHVFLDSDVIVREDEPSSLIAFALSSEDYITKLEGIRGQDPAGAREQSKKGEAPFIDACAAGLDQIEVKKSLLRATGTHLRYQFAEGSAKMQCKIFYAEQFDAIRRSCGIGERIIESLSRCAKWNSQGGKTKSVFLKTLDDRLVLKSLSPIETQAFLKFAPAYFRMMAKVLFRDLQSCIAKMLGFFQIVIKNPVTGTEIKWDLLIMENLFYDRPPCRTFDLKGSMRNRKIQATGEQNEVLLDENMVEYIYESPLFTREHSKNLLKNSVYNDTLFLSQQNVMDYSLMVAVDEQRKELVIGIIDCIRTYTWDKKLETWIKDRGFAGGNRNRPTVTSPKEYKKRFREAMHRYILQAPNCWHQFTADKGDSRPRVEFSMDKEVDD